MRILVCVKQVCDSADTLSVNNAGAWVEHAPKSVFRINRFDEYAIEEGLRITERHSGSVLDIVSIGPQRVQAGIRRALGMGAHHGIHILKGEDTYVTPLERAFLISEAARSRHYDLVLTGVMAEDDMEGQVGGLTAAMLAYACATNVIYEETVPDRGEITVEREIEGGSRECITLKLPAVLTIQSGINIPRYPVLSHMLKSRTAALEQISAGMLGPSRPGQVIEKISPSPPAGIGELIEGSPYEKAEKLLEILHRHSLV